MKSILMTVFAFVFAMAVSAQEQKADDLIKMNTELHDFGKVKQGTPVSYYFEVTNITDKPVVIENAWASCGCTVPEYSKEPIAAGETIKLKVQYNAAAAGHFEKDVFVKLAGITQPKTIHIKGDVEAPGN
ncbi:MAG: DUF1573 domain-containing protein [Terrimonas sp.]|nr:DUF1573 domain-containing protein [Terrimonas sp.]